MTYYLLRGRRLYQTYGVEMNDYCMKRAQMKWWGTIFFDTSRGDRSSLPLPPIACKYGGPPFATAEAGINFLSWFVFPWNT